MSVIDEQGKLLGMITMRDLYAPLEEHDARQAVEEDAEGTEQPADNPAW
jgi:Mg/Co/Ni transporter MgtE